MKSDVDEKYRKKVLNYVTEAVALFDGNSLSGQNISKFNEIVYVLGNLIDLPPLKPNSETKRRFISSAIKKAKSYRRLNLYKFLRRIDIEYSNYLKRPKQKYYVVFTSNVEYPSYKGKRLFRILETPIRIHNFAYIHRNFKFGKRTWDNLMQYGFSKKNTLLYLMNCSYLLIEEHAVDENSAFHSANHKKELLRAIFNYCETHRMVTY